LKSKFWAVVKSLSEKSPETGLVLNDFTPNKFCLIEDKDELVSLTCLQNMEYSFVLFDLAKCLNKFSLFVNDSKIARKKILEGFKEVKSLNTNDTEIIHLLMLIDLMLCILDNEDIKTNMVNELTDFFEFIYLNKNEVCS